MRRDGVVSQYGQMLTWFWGFVNALTFTDFLFLYWNLLFPYVYGARGFLFVSLSVPAPPLLSPISQCLCHRKDFSMAFPCPLQQTAGPVTSARIMVARAELSSSLLDQP